MNKPKIVKGKHKLSQEEIVDISKELAESMREQEEKKNEASVVATQYKEEIKQIEATIQECLDKIRTGEESRDYECKEVRDEEKKEKSYVCIKTGKVIKTVPFTAADYQHEIGITESTTNEEEEEEEK